MYSQNCISTSRLWATLAPCPRLPPPVIVTMIRTSIALVAFAALASAEKTNARPALKLRE